MYMSICCFLFMIMHNLAQMCGTFFVKTQDSIGKLKNHSISRKVLFNPKHHLMRPLQGLTHVKKKSHLEVR